MKMLSNLKRKFELWLLSDTLGSQNLTNANDSSNAFLEKFGIHQLCLIEMFDQESKIFFSPKTAGFGFIVKCEAVNVSQLVSLTSFSELIDAGFGLLISRITTNNHEPQNIIISVSCEAAYTDEKTINVLLDIKDKLFKKLSESFDQVSELEAVDLIEFLVKVFNPKLMFGSHSKLSYDNSYFIKDQLVVGKQLSLDKTNIVVEKDFIEFEEGNKVIRNIGFGVQRYFNRHKEYDESYYENYLQETLSMSDTVIVTTLGIYNPLTIFKTKKDQATNEAYFKQKLQVFHIMNCYIEGDRKNIESKTKLMIDDFKRLMGHMNYQVAIVSNRQLGNLFFSVPTNLNGDIANDIYSLRLSTSTTKVLAHDLLPIVYGINTGKV